VLWRSRCTCTYVYLHAYIHANSHTYIQRYIRPYIHTHMHVCTHTQIHTYYCSRRVCVMMHTYVCIKISELCPQQDALAQSQQYWAREHWRACGGTRLQTRSTSIVADVSAALNWSVQPFCCNPSLCSFMHRFYKSEHIVMIFLLPLFAYLNHS